jgi:3-isopropylmalate dehydrogenase
MSMVQQQLACLAGDGVGPELMGEATRTLARLSDLHALSIEDMHLPVGGEAVTRYGHPLPLVTRSGYRRANAILVAAPHEPALEAMRADLDFETCVTRVHLPHAGDVLVFGPVGSASPGPSLERAFTSAASRRGRVTAVGSSPAWRAAVAEEHERWSGMEVDYRTIGETLVGLREPTHGDLAVVVTEAELVSPLTDAAAHLGGSPATVALGWLSEEGPGLFVPGVRESSDVAGFGVADPTAVLLTLSLLLAEGLQQRSAARTLERAVTAASQFGGSFRETRAYTDAVLAMFGDTRTDVEHFDEVWH